MSLVTASEAAESRLPPRSGVSLDGVLECPAELGARDDPDCLESRPPATVSAWSSMLKDGMGGLRIGLEGESVCASAAWGGGIGGRSRAGAAEDCSAIVWRSVMLFLLPASRSSSRWRNRRCGWMRKEWAGGTRLRNNCERLRCNAEEALQSVGRVCCQSAPVLQRGMLGAAAGCKTCMR